jgi:hypothetical protein
VVLVIRPMDEGIRKEAFTFIKSGRDIINFFCRRSDRNILGFVSSTTSVRTIQYVLYSTKVVIDNL